MNDILTYMNTRQYFTNRWRGEIFDNSFYLSDKELQRFNVSRVQLEAMPQVVRLDVNTYNVQGVNEINVSLLKPHGKPLNDLHKYMMQCVVSAELPTTVQTTPFWNTFLKHRAKYPELFFTIDSFAGRVHTPISGMSKKLRPYLKLQGEAVCSFDVSQCQPTLLANILQLNIGNNAFSEAINNGTDIYTMLQQNAGLKTRDEAKKLFFKIIFGRPSDELERLFAGADFIKWVNWYKSTPDPRNPRSGKIYNNLAWLLQTYEVRVMGEIWRNLAQKSIPYLTVHDEIICRQSDAKQAEAIIHSVLSKHFKSYKLNTDHLTVSEPKPKVSLFEIGMNVIGERNHLAKTQIIAAIMQAYNVIDTRAMAGFEKLLKNEIIMPTNVGTYLLTHSTPF